MKRENFNFQLFAKGMKILHSTTKMDIRLHDQHQRTIFQFVNHAIPAVLRHSDLENIKYVQQALRKNEPNDYFHYTDPSGLGYLGTGLWQQQIFYGSILIGPVISNPSIVDVIQDLMVNRSFPIGERQTLMQFYHTLPILGEVEFVRLGELLVHLCVHPHIHYDAISADSPKPVHNTRNQQVVLEENIQQIGQRYAQQNELMNTITKGDKIKALDYIDQLTAELVTFSDRVPGSPIRVSKNMGFVLNTMCRMAAEKSGVHPVYLHHISERFAILIEKTSTIPNLKKLYFTMVEEYCELVSSVSTGHYSSIVKKTMDYILLNLGSPLPLKQIAAHVHVNPAHLSRKFKADTGMTITDFIHRKRIDEAKLYLQREHVSISDVAFAVGFNDLNYFSKIFKRYTSMTPSEYRTQRPSS